MISLKGIEKVFNSGNNVIHALKDVSLEIEQGEIFGIIGRPGAGKSTLARCMNLLERPSAGSVIIDQCPMTALGNEGLRVARQKIGVLTKVPYLLSSRTVYENIALSLEFVGAEKSTIEQTVNSLIATLGLSDKAKAYPNALNNSQKQKVALARTLAQKPKVLICDEITQHIDLKSSHALFQLLRELNEEQKLTIVYITQDLDILKPICNRIAILHQGEIVEQGTLLNIFVNPNSMIAKEMVKSATRLEMPAVLRRRLRANRADNLNPVLRISFLGPSAQEPLIAQVIQQFALTLHIIQAHLETIHSQTLGIMVAEMAGKEDNIQKAIEFLETKGLHIEVLGYVPRST